MAKTQKMFANRVLLDLMEADLPSKQAERQGFFAGANRLLESIDSTRQHAHPHPPRQRRQRS
jgi:hypothetical protein